jgi:hypothetical protein
MISVIICSVNPTQLQEVSQNISETIGLPYELIAVDNRNIIRGICSVYNDAAVEAKYNYLCFVHEDVKFHTKGWGAILFDLLEKSKIGLVGVSGPTYKSAIPSSWTACKDDFYRTNTIQHFGASQNPLIHTKNPDKNIYSEVAVVDGVFLATRKDVFSEFSFDENRLTGFHGYDFDLSMQIRQKYKIVVTHQIFLEHFSAGNYNHQWLSDTFFLHQKWKKKLPIFIGQKRRHDYKSDYIAASALLNYMLRMSFNNILILKYYFLLVTYFFPLNKFSYSLSILKYLLKK